MLMGGKGRRLSGITNFKPFLLVNNKPIFKLVFDNLNSKEKVIITNNYYKKKLIKKDYKIIFVKETKSMFDTIYESRNVLQNKSNYFLTSCDCIGIVDKKILSIFLKKNKKDLVFFAFKFSYFQKSLGNSHTQLIINKNKVINVKVKNRYNSLGYGHAGFFWIKNAKVFKYLDFFKNSNFYKNLKREVLIDDYFKFLVIKKLISANHFLLEDYIHIGSEKEYREYNYWNNYFNEKKLA
jgi:NDP-sugar pyrophosphorylase family protein